MERDVNDKQESTPPPIQPGPIPVKDGHLVPTNSTELVRTVANIASGGGFPKRFDTAQKQLAAYNMARSLCAEKWQLALNHMANIEGELRIYGELPGTCAERTREVQEKHVYCIDDKYQKICMENKNLHVMEPFSGVCVIQRKGRERKEFYYTLEDAKKAGQYPPMKNEWVDNRRTGKKIENLDSPWHRHLKTMLMRKAMALAIKFEFPDAIMGASIAEYDLDRAPDLEEMREVGDGSVEPATGSFRSEIENLE